MNIVNNLLSINWDIIFNPPPQTFKDKALSFLSKGADSIKEKAAPYYFQAKQIASPYYHSTIQTVSSQFDSLVQTVTPTIEEIKPQLPFIGGVSAMVAGTTLLASGTNQVFKSESNKKAAVAKIVSGIIGIGLGTYALAPIVKPLFDAYLNANQSRSLEDMLANYSVHVCNSDEQAKQTKCFQIVVK